MWYIIFLFYIFTSTALGCDNKLLDVNFAEGISAKVLLKNNDSLLMSILNHGKIISTEEIDVSSEKKIMLHSKIIIVMVIKTSVYGI